MHPQPTPVLLRNHATINDGATPNETTSDKESSSPPMGDFALRARAAKPSKKSKTAATNIIAEAHKTRSWHKKSIETQPLMRLQHVMVLGICFTIDIIQFFCKYKSFLFLTIIIWRATGVRFKIFIEKRLVREVELVGYLLDTQIGMTK